MICRRCLALALLSLVLHLVLLSLRLEPRTDPAGMLPRNAGDASQLAAPSEQLLHDIRAFDMEYVLDFVNMQRFQDPLLVHILEAMRTPGDGKPPRRPGKHSKPRPSGRPARTHA